MRAATASSASLSVAPAGHVHQLRVNPVRSSRVQVREPPGAHTPSPVSTAVGRSTGASAQVPGTIPAV